LSVDDRPDFEACLSNCVSRVQDVTDVGINEAIDLLVPPGFPSLSFGIETAIRDFVNGGSRLVFANAFYDGKPIPINGLIWMGDMQSMISQVDAKIAAGFTCIKMKIGGIDFQQEIQVLEYIRSKDQGRKLTIRLDANGAFNSVDALSRLSELSRLGVHSIEQPVAPGEPIMARICKESPIPIALDEELIGVLSYEEKVFLLRATRPAYIVLKPTLHGGFKGCSEWIEIAEGLGVGWWMTSALESNVGLNAICQFTAQFPIAIPQGLGTGALYVENFECPLRVRQGYIYCDPSISWDPIRL
jgi:L-alanine-DL-glutamate epimerase-like enolase superfamily enzyme